MYTWYIAKNPILQDGMRKRLTRDPNSGQTDTNILLLRILKGDGKKLGKNQYSISQRYIVRKPIYPLVAAMYIEQGLMQRACCWSQWGWGLSSISSSEIDNFTAKKKKGYFPPLDYHALYCRPAEIFQYQGRGKTWPYGNPPLSCHASYHEWRRFYHWKLIIALLFFPGNGKASSRQATSHAMKCHSAVYECRHTIPTRGQILYSAAFCSLWEMVVSEI